MSYKSQMFMLCSTCLYVAKEHFTSEEKKAFCLILCALYSLVKLSLWSCSKHKWEFIAQWCFIQQLPLINCDLWSGFFLFLILKYKKKSWVLEALAFNAICIFSISLCKLRITTNPFLLEVSLLKRKPIFILFNQ